ncbi:hypothetical protein, partial [Methylacidiphilum caldifontis]|uniref:hypothetical protein n=1 Tax=Methylacidiphilum caldifontis TaxID=2795386 RepID=UPI001ABC2464
ARPVSRTTPDPPWEPDDGSKSIGRSSNPTTDPHACRCGASPTQWPGWPKAAPRLTAEPPSTARSKPLPLSNPKI